MKFLSSLIILSTSVFTTSPVQAEILRTDAYDSYVIIATNHDEMFRFVGKADFSVCATGVRFIEELVKLRDGEQHRVYALKALTEETGDSGGCVDGGPQTLVTTIKEIKTKWRRVKAGNSVTVLVPTWITLEEK